MSAASVQVLDMLSQRMIDVDEAVRLLKAIRSPVAKTPIVSLSTPFTNEAEVILENIGMMIRPQLCYGNLIMK